MEEAQWFYEDFIRPLDPSLPSLSLRAFSLRIFQHCPLFSQWDAQHYTTAFAEFLAYKTRVPVRGAIMLNEDMDQVVLVKGWKKNANWSFPRGKINKDENDLDCAVREVYEETGFDIKEAGLVQEEKDTKYIEITMREQNMRLYVFRGVPMETYFAPRTRKEISKIEWYKLTDLPTARKSKHQEGTGEALAISANKFYMVAPFLVPLKKWISQQKKRHGRYSSKAFLVPPILADETVTEDEHDYSNGPEQPVLNRTISSGPSDLPEVTVQRSVQEDPSAQLKHMLNIGIYQPLQQTSQAIPPAPTVDHAKSSALLALLRQGSQPLVEAPPQTPLEQVMFEQQMPRSPQHTHPRPPPFSSMQPPPMFPIRFQQPIFAPPIRQYENPGSFDHDHSPETTARAPYRQTGDPEFAPRSMEEQEPPRIPPASALPKLTNHTKSLLDVFKGDFAKKPERMGEASPVLQPVGHQSRHPVVGDQVVDNPPFSLSQPRAPAAGHQANLLELFRGPSAQSSSLMPRPKQALGPAPVELAAQATPESHEGSGPSEDLLKKMLQRKNDGSRSVRRDGLQRDTSTTREGKTAATVSGPLNQPHFDVIQRPQRQVIGRDEFARSPQPTGRTLFDPNQGAQPTPPSTMKILSRPEGERRSPARSPRPAKSTAKPAPRPTHAPPQAVKPFQPQILRRPQENSQPSSPALLPNSLVQPDSSVRQSSTNFPPKSASPPKHYPSRLTTTLPLRRSRPGTKDSSPATHSPSSLAIDTLPPLAMRPTARDESHRKTLLSLFGTPASAEEGNTPRQKPLRNSSPASASQLVSPLNEQQATISTRSRMGSMASMVSGASQAPVEKKQTNAGDRAFLLGYLGRIASQEG